MSSENMAACGINFDKVKQKKSHDRSLGENLLLSLNFKEKDYNPTLRHKNTVLCKHLSEENILASINSNVTRLEFNIREVSTEDEVFLTGYTSTPSGTTLAVPYHKVPDIRPKNILIKFGPGYNPNMENAKPFVPLDIPIQRAVVQLGRIVISNMGLHPHDAPLVVCPTDIPQRFIVAPSVIITHSPSLFLKFNGLKSLNHKFQVTSVNQKLYRRYLGLMTLMNKTTMTKCIGPFQPHTLWFDNHAEGEVAVKND